MADSQELLLQLIGDESDESSAPLLMEHLLNRGMEHVPHVYQFGMKNNQTLKAHIQNVMCFSYQLAEILGLEDIDKTNLIAAAYVHDLNKFPEFNNKSYDSIANIENVQKIMDHMLLESEHDFDISIDTIVSVIRAHSGHLHVDGDSLFASAQRDKARKKLIGILQAADTFDLSHNFHEKDQKEKALRIINGLIDDFQYEYTWHYFSDNRGVYTNILQNSIVDIYQNQGAVPLLFYPEGVWYLLKKGNKISISPNQISKHLQSIMDGMSVDDSSKILKYAKVGFKFTQNPLKLNLDSEKIINLIIEQILNRKEKAYQDKYEALKQQSGAKCFNAYENWRNKSSKRKENYKKAKSVYEKIVNQQNLKLEFKEEEDAFSSLSKTQKNKILKAKSKYLDAEKEICLEEKFISNPLWESIPDNLFYSDLNVMRCGDLVSSFALLLLNYMGFESDDAWNLAAEIAGLNCDDYPELKLKFFNVQSDRGFRTAAVLHENGIDFETIKEKYLIFIESIIKKTEISDEPDQYIVDYIASNFRNQDTDFKVDNSVLGQYIKSNHKQCCHCSGGTSDKWMSGDLPKGIKPQLFSNRLKGGGGEPKRNICKVCQQSFIAEKLVYETYDNHYYLHLFSDGGEHSSHAEPGIFLESLKSGILNLHSSDFRSFLIQPGQVIREYLNEKIPRLYGEPKKQWGMLIPKFSQSVGGQISIGINPPGGKKSNDSTRFIFALFHLLIISSRFNLRGIISKSSIPPLKADEFDRLYIDHIPLSFKALIPENDLDSKASDKLWEGFTGLYGLRNTYDMMEEKEIINLAKTLYDKTGLELFYYLKKAYAKTERTKDFHPWVKAWPYLKPFILEEELMPIKKMAEIALINHFHGKSWNETSQAKPLDLAFDALSKHREPETEKDLKMVILHDVTRGLERLSQSGKLGKERYDAVMVFVDTFFNDVFKERYKGDKNKMIKDQKRIRAAFLGYLTVIRNEMKQD